MDWGRLQQSQAAGTEEFTLPVKYPWFAENKLQKCFEDAKGNGLLFF